MTIERAGLGEIRLSGNSLRGQRSRVLIFGLAGGVYELAIARGTRIHVSISTTVYEMRNDSLR